MHRAQRRRNIDNWGGRADIHIFVFCPINFFWNRLLYSLWTRIYEYLLPPNYRYRAAIDNMTKYKEMPSRVLLEPVRTSKSRWILIKNASWYSSCFMPGNSAYRGRYYFGLSNRKSCAPSRIPSRKHVDNRTRLNELLAYYLNIAVNCCPFLSIAAILPCYILL
jgi:hypothetical protein